MRMKEKSTSTKRTWRRELSEWGIIIAVGLILYIGGWHTEVIGFAQRILLSTHIIQPKIADADIQNYDDLAANFEQAAYNFYLSDELGAPVSLYKHSPQKLNLLAQQIRGMPVQKAMDEMKFSRKRAAKDLRDAGYFTGRCPEFRQERTLQSAYWA